MMSISNLRQRLRDKPFRRRLFKLSGRLRGKTLWQNLKTYCLFVGYTRSGHSAVGSAIDAHPEAVVSHELNAVQRYVHGTGREELFLEIFWLAREQARMGRRSPRVDGGAYLHRIGGQLKHTPGGIGLIGDKKGAGTVREVQRHGLDLIENFKTTIGLPVKIVYVMRNPFDMVAAAIVNDEAHMPYSFLQLVSTVAQIRDRYLNANWLDVYHEDVIADPKSQMTRILNFLDLPVLDEHLEQCAAYFYDSPHKRRFEVSWTPQLKLQVQEAIDHYDFLRQYTWDS